MTAEESFVLPDYDKVGVAAPSNEEVVLPPYQENAPIVSEEHASDTAFYTAASSSPNPIEDFSRIKGDLVQKGTSKDVEDATKLYNQELEDSSRATITSLINSPTVSKDVKLHLLKSFKDNAHLDKDLRDKYAERIAALELGTTKSDEKSQNEVAKLLPASMQKTKEDELLHKAAKGSPGILNYIHGLGSIGSNLLTAIPAGVAGIVEAVKEKDAVKGQLLMGRLSEAWATNPKDPMSQEAKNILAESLSFLGRPSEWMSEQVINQGGSGSKAVQAKVLLDPLNFIPVAGATKLIKGVKVRAGSPLDVSTKANPKLASELAQGALDDATNTTSSALGASKGEILSDFALPKLDRNKDIVNNPSLVEEIRNLDSEVQRAVQLNSLDANIVDVSTRNRELAATYNVIRENNNLFYRQNMSSINMFNDVFEGVAVFAKNEHYAFSSRTDVLQAHKKLTDSILDSAEATKGSVLIRDLVTKDLYTPEELMKAPQFQTITERLANVPLKTADGTPIVKGNTGRTREDGSKVSATLVRDSNRKPVKIIVDLEALKNDFNQKVWTKPKVEGVTPIAREAFKTSDEYVQFVLAHEEAHVNMPRPEGMSKPDYENLMNQKAMAQLQNLKETFRSEVAPKQFVLEWAWEKQYDMTDLHMYGGPTSFLGVDATKLMRGSLGKWIGSTGVFSKWFENSGLRLAEKQAHLEHFLIEPIQKYIVKSKFKKEVAKLIEMAEENVLKGNNIGKEWFSIAEISKEFPYLSTKQVAQVHESHVMWRRINHYLHALTNINYKTRLHEEGFTKGIYLEDKYVGPVIETITFKNRGEAPKEVWDYDLDKPVIFTWAEGLKVGKTYNTTNQQLVMLKTPKVSKTGDSFEYALVSSKTKLGLLPSKVLPRIPGYSPLKHQGHFFIRVIPTQLRINGVDVSDPERLRTHASIVGAAKTEFEANSLAGIGKDPIKNSIKDEYPNHVVDIVSDKDTGGFGRILMDREAHENLIRNAMSRGERLRSIDGVAPLEDRLKTLIGTVQSISKQYTMSHWESATKNAFMRDFGDLVPSGEFPTHIDQIEGKLRMNRVEARHYTEARRAFDHYAKIKTFEQLSDYLWTRSFHGIADILENFKIPANLLRDLGNKGNLLFSVPKQVASTLFIHLNPLRQWIVQPAQLLEMYAINPHTAIQNFADMVAIRTAILSEAPSFKGKAGILGSMARKMAPTMSKTEFDATLKAIKDSGLLKSIDHNMLVNGIISDTTRNLVETSWEKAYNNLIAVPKAIPRVGRAIGFDQAELTNRIGLWLIARDLWKSKNPTKNWNTPEIKEYISAEALKLSGAMNRAGSLPYQSGSLSVLMQFAAISQKLTVNILQDNATMLSASQRARLAVARMALWGAKYGTVGGAAIYYYIDKSEDKTIKENANVLRVGIMDRATRMLTDALTDSGNSPELQVGKSVSPYGVPYADLYFEVLKAVDGDATTDPRFPAVGAMSTLYEAKGKIQSWFIPNRISGVESWKQAFLQASKVASGMNNLAKAEIMFGMRDKISKNGNHTGLEATAGTALAQVFGITTWAEEDIYKAGSFMKDRGARITNQAEQIHQWMVNQASVEGSRDGLDTIDDLSAYMNVLRDDEIYTDVELGEIYSKVVDMQIKAYKDTKTSILLNIYRHLSEKNDSNLQNAIDKLKQHLTPDGQKLIDIHEGKEAL